MLHWLPDSRRLAVAANNLGQSGIYDARTGERLIPLPNASEFTLGANATDVVLWNEKRLRFFDAATGKSLQDGAMIVGLTSRDSFLTANGRQVTSLGDGQIRTFDAYTGQVQCRVPSQFLGDTSLGFRLSPDGSLLVPFNHTGNALPTVTAIDV